MFVWSYTRGGHWTRAELPDSDVAGWGDYLRNLGFERFGLQVESPWTGVGITVWKKAGVSDSLFLVDLSGEFVVETILVPTLPDLLDFLVFLSPFLTVVLQADVLTRDAEERARR